MVRKLIGCSMSGELEASIAFITWQQCGTPPEVVLDAGISLRAGKGSPAVVLLDGDVQLAVGFWGITRYWQYNGLCLC
jgi:hypothetical protein